MRKKEQAEDYRFISDPDLPIIKIKEQKIRDIKSKLPETPAEKLEKLIKRVKLYAWHILLKKEERFMVL